jgi:hypothetical protein
MRAFFHWGEGSFGFVAFGWWLHVKAPWAFAYFSERYGYEKWRKLGRGWRFQFRKMKRFDDDDSSPA